MRFPFSHVYLDCWPARESVMKYLSYLCFIFCTTSIVQCNLHDSCSTDNDCSDEKQVCHENQCICHSGLIEWHEKYCLEGVPPKRYGNLCENDQECSISGDPNLKCLKTVQDKEEKRCLCSSSFELVEIQQGVEKCLHNDFHFRVNIMADPGSNLHESRQISPTVL